MRLQRYLAQAGIASRRKAEELIAAGLVRVNGRVVRELGTSVVDGDRVEYSGRLITPVVDHTYLVLNKPAGVMTTMSDPEGRRTVADVMRHGGVTHHVVPVGRLDYDTSGVLLLTDDGDLAHVLMHPKFGVEKTYRATVRGRLTPDQTQSLLRGVRLEDGRAEPAQLRVVATNRDRSTIDLTIHEGKNRQVRKMFEQVGHPVLDLVRTKFGPIGIGALALGAIRDVTDRELAALRIALDAPEDAER